MNQLVPICNRVDGYETRAYNLLPLRRAWGSFRTSGSGSSSVKPLQPERYLCTRTTQSSGLNNPLYQNRYRRLETQAMCEDKRLPFVKRKTNSFDFVSGLRFSFSFDRLSSLFSKGGGLGGGFLFPFGFPFKTVGTEGKLVEEYEMLGM